MEKKLEVIKRYHKTTLTTVHSLGSDSFVVLDSENIATFLWENT